MFFTQVFSYRDQPFRGEIRADDSGYVIDEDKVVLDTLSNIAVEMIRSHDFHRLQTDPSHFFSEILFEEVLEDDMEMYSATDRLNHPVAIVYDRSIQQLRKVTFQNMMDTSEVINIIYKKWAPSEYGDLASEVDIIQAKRDTFSFVFEKVEIE